MKPRDFHYRHFLPEVILQCLRWYLRYPISYRNYVSTIDFMLSSHRDIAAAKKFFKQAMINSALKPKVINTDKHSSYNKAIMQLKDQKILPNLLLHRQCKYLNNIIESDHSRIKRRINPKVLKHLTQQEDVSLA